MNIKKITTAENLARLLFLGCFLFFFLLLLKNPFSERNLISNLEPYPDSIHYISPALSFIKGDGFYIEREGRAFKPTVPFLYSLTLVPGFLINSDARFFYVTNVIFAFIGFLLFYFFLIKITSNKFIALLVLFIYLTNYFVYWYPNLPMAENLVLTLFIASLFLFIRNPSVLNSAIAGFLAVSFYGAKYANFTLSFVFVLFYFLKILTGSGEYKNIFGRLSIKQFTITGSFILSTLAGLVLFFFIEYLIRGSSIFEKIQYLSRPLLMTSKESAVSVISVNPWFSYTYFNKNFETYINALFGGSMRFLWDFTPLLPGYIALLSFAGLVAGIYFKTTRLVSLMLLCFILLPVIFLSTFYAADARYIYHVIPALLSGFGLFLSYVYKLLTAKKRKILFYVFLIILFAFYFGSNFQRLKYQISLNLRHAETPWYSISVKTFNEFFEGREFLENQKPILITALPPYYVDFLSNSNYTLLPLSKEQEFSNSKEIVWGEEDYIDFFKIYSKYLDQGVRVFVTNAALGNAPYLHRDFNIIKENFNLTEVKKGCFDTCNIYELKLKE